jgi:septum formation protein
MIVLASSSPRRTALLTMLGIAHEVEPAQIDETPQNGETPRQRATRLARDKARSVAERYPGRVVLGADTVVVLGDEMLGKPTSPDDAIAMLGRMSGRDHTVVTAVALARDDQMWDRVDETRVWIRDLPDELIGDYVATGEPLDKAGSYGLQGLGTVLVERIEGDYFGVIGLPLRLVVELLAEAGTPYRFT